MPELTWIMAVSILIASTPVLFASLGEILFESCGIINLGAEGVLLIGAVTAAAVQAACPHPFAAYLAAAAVGSMFGLVHGYMVEILGIEVLSAGLILYFLGRGTSAVAGVSLVGRSLAGNSASGATAMAYLAIVLSAAMWYTLFRTRLGVQIRATGADRIIAVAAGVRVRRIRLGCTLLGGALQALGGAFIALAIAHTWIEDMSGARGWLAVGLVILARLNPLWALLATLLLGAVLALQLNAQAVGIGLSPYFLSMIPYLLTILAMAFRGNWHSRFQQRKLLKLS